jgi:hypothetical protein
LYIPIENGELTWSHLRDFSLLLLLCLCLSR